MANPADSADGDDALLTAYLDGELAGEERARLEKRLLAEPPLKARLDRLGRGGRAFGPAFAALMASAPEDKLAAMLDELAGRHARRAERPVSWPGRARMLAAALVLFVAGGFAGYLLQPQPEQPGWRQVVAEYHGLTTTETLNAVPENAAVISEAVAAASTKLAMDITADKLALPNAALKRAQLYDYRGRPLVQFAYLTGDGPVALCIIASPRPDEALAFEQREGFNIVFWTEGGHGYMLIGKASRAALEAYAGDIAARV